MFGTPDFGHSDVWHFNFAIKFFLSKVLKENALPLWSKDLGTGFPLLAEGQMGLGNLYNLLAFRLLDPVLAFNLGFVVIFVTLAIGSYLYARIINLSRISAIFLATIFSFSGVFVTQIVHYNLIQAASFLPLEFFLAEKWLLSGQKRFLIIFSLVVSQQIYSGFQQSVLITAIGLAIYLLFRARQMKKFWPIVPLGLAFVFGTTLALPQILISSQLIRESSRTGGVYITEMMKYQFPPIHLLSFLNPFIFGDPHFATYPGFSHTWGIFWESTGYLGIIPIILVGYFFLNRRGSPANIVKLSKIFIVTGAIALILCLGKYTPFFFLFQLPPLSFFRVPPRFLLLLVWSLAVLACFGLEKIKSGRAKLLILLITIADLGIFFVKSNAIINPTVWLKKPESVEFLAQDKSWFRVSSFFSYFPWNNIYLKRGWQDMNDFLPLRNNLDPNQNLFWQTPSADVYAGLVTKRFEMWRTFFNSGVIGNERTSSVRINDSSVKLLSLSGVKYIFTPWPIDKLEFVATISARPLVMVYKNAEAKPHAYLTRDYVVANSISDLRRKLLANDSTAVVLEQKINLASSSGELGTATVVLDRDQEVIVRTISDRDAILILSDTYFPGWQAEVDGVETTIFPANLNQRAVIVPQGNHSIRFVYQPFALRNILPWLHP